MKKALAREPTVTAIASMADNYFRTLAYLISNVTVTDSTGQPLATDHGFASVSRSAHAVHDAGNKIIFIGNGGSAGIASACAWPQKNGPIVCSSLGPSCSGRHRAAMASGR